MIFPSIFQQSLQYLKPLLQLPPPPTKISIEWIFLDLLSMICLPRTTILKLLIPIP